MPKVDIGSEIYDSYASVDWADVYLGGDVLRAASWATRTPDAKGRGLVSATRVLVTMPWVTDPAPPPYTGAPKVVQEVTAMLAADLLAKPRLFSDASGNSNVKTAKAGSASVEFFKPTEDAAPIPTFMWDMLVAAGLVGASTGQLDDGPYVSGASDYVRPIYGRYGWDWPIAAEDHD